MRNLASNHHPRNHRADQGKPCTDEHHCAEPSDVGLIDGLLDGRLDRSTHALRDLDAGQLDVLPGNGLLHPGWQIQARQTRLKGTTEDAHEDDIQDGNRQAAGNKQRAADPLHRTCDDELRNRWRQAAPDRRE
ncbi:MAG: hypothetical protein ABI465_12620 [Ktedonobacteraceae bacterium]